MARCLANMAKRCPSNWTPEFSLLALRWPDMVKRLHAVHVISFVLRVQKERHYVVEEAHPFLSELLNAKCSFTTYGHRFSIPGAVR
jgi:hypothetical protein